MRQGSSTIIFTIAFLVLLVAIPAAYFVGKNQNQSVENYPSSTQPSPQTTDTTILPSPAGNGTITGTLRYPSEFLPEGKVIAKNINTGELHTVEYEGLLFDKGTDSFSISVPEGTYYLKYEAHPDTINPKIIINGYYTVHDGTVQDATHDLIPVKVNSGETKEIGNIADFYYGENEPNF